MLSHPRLAALGAIWCLPLLVCAAALRAADRPARVITPSGSPVWLDPQRTLLFDSPSLSVMRRNENSAPVHYALRIWVFGERSDVKGTQDYCTYDTIGGNSRGRIVVPLEIPGVTLRDRAVVTVSAAASDRAAWKLRESDRDQLDAALAAAQGSTGRLTLDRQDAVPGAWSCGCDCAALQTACEQRCGAGRAAAACTRTFDGGCSSTCSCR
jgi:hypothetical protein